MKVWKQVVKFRKAQIDEQTWAWFQESVDAPSTVPALREAHPDFPTGTLELVKNAMAIDAETIITAGPGSATPDDLVLSVWRQLIRQEFAEGVTFSRIHLVAEHATRPHGLRDPAIWTTFAATFAPHQDVYNAFGYGTFDVLQAIYAASDNKLVIETHHLDGYNLLKMVGLPSRATADARRDDRRGHDMRCRRDLRGIRRLRDRGGGWSANVRDRRGLLPHEPTGDPTRHLRRVLTTVPVRGRLRPSYCARGRHGRQLHRRLLGSSPIKRAAIAARRRGVRRR